MGSLPACHMAVRGPTTVAKVVRSNCVQVGTTHCCNCMICYMSTGAADGMSHADVLVATQNDCPHQGNSSSTSHEAVC
jgi:hypothetical protein